MRTPPTNWTTLMAQPHETETRIDIAGVSYYGYDGNIGIWSCETRPMLFDKLSVGNCCSATINLVLANPQTIPTMAKMELYVRLTNGTITTAWVRKGVYYIDTREWDAQHEFLTITGYDAMLKTEQDYFTPPVTITGWPKTDAAVVSEICTRIGVELDARTVINKGYMVQVPAVSSDGKDSDTLREVLGWIGGMYGGNWCITDEGKLRLVPLVPTETVAVGTDALDLSTTPAYDALGIVHLVVSEEAEYVAGTSGRSIEISCPWGTQAMANNILTAIGGYVYQPLSVTTATEANPLWELGDAVTVNGYTSVIAAMPTSFGLKYTADIEAPESEEINHEYPYQDKGTRDIERKIAQSSASLRVDIDSIKAMVSGLAAPWEAGQSYSVGDIVEYDSKFYRCTVANSDSAFNPSKWTEIDSGVVESILQLAVGKMTLSVSGSGRGSSIVLTSGSVRITSAATYFDTDEAHFSGSLSANRISAGSIDADVVSVKDAFAVQMLIGNEWTTVGYVGAATGIDASGNTTHGAVLKSVNGNSYVIATNAGVRMQQGNTGLWIADNAISYRIGGGSITPLGYAVFS